MSYCKEGDKPKVEFKFDDSPKRIYYSKVSPIQIETGRYAKDDNNQDYDAEGFEILYSNGSKQTVINYRTRIDPTSGQPNIQFWSCGGKDWDNRQPDGSYSIWYPYPFPVVGINRAVKCPPPYPDGDCYIRVKFNNTLLFEARGKCPSESNVICGNCPPGQCEVKTDRYPGYCCVDCKSTASKINNLVSKARCCDG